MPLNFEGISCESKPCLIRIWPDDFWQCTEEGDPPSWKSDDFYLVDFNDFEAMDKLDRALRNAIVADIMGEEYV